MSLAVDLVSLVSRPLVAAAAVIGRFVTEGKAVRWEKRSGWPN
jgi:hypothetical protein